ncbi:MAG TPA: RNA-binding protein [Candidatus Woesearchaeota archaeon]|nr:RNA-binding protein [Candidatus Woesearchaeota archaeon]
MKMGNILIEEKSIVVPGEELAEGMDFLPSSGCFREGEKIFANKLGILNVQNRVLRVVPLSGHYIPMNGDLVVGRITEAGFSGWSADIGASEDASLPTSEAMRDRVDRYVDLQKYFKIGDLIAAKVISVTPNRIVINMRERGLRKLREGRIVKVSPTKVPRVIGKQGSMVGMLKEHTKCEITVGQNGYIWVNGPVEGQFLFEKAVGLIEENAHKSGLTDLIKEMLEKGVKNE